MSCCCCLASQPTHDKEGRLKSYETGSKFQTSMCRAPWAACPWSCFWCTGQCFPLTCGITQFLLRRKVLDGDMSKYRCCQGHYAGCLCFKRTSCCETVCPSLCLCFEAHCCNFAAVSASRLFVMEKYNLSSDPCDYLLIQFNNCLQCLTCLCTVLAVVCPPAREAACILHVITDIVYGIISGCMTAQTAHEINYRLKAVLPHDPNAIPIETQSVAAVPV